MSRILLYIVAVPLLLVLLGAVLASLLLDEEKLLALAAEEVRKQSGARLEVAGEAQLKLFPQLGLRLEQISLEMPGDEQTGLQANSVQIGVQLLPLLSQQVAIDSIELNGLVITSVSEPPPAPIDTSDLSDEQLAEFYRKREAEIAAAGEAAATQTALAAPLALEVGSLRVTDSRLELREAGGDPTIIEISRFKASDLNLAGRPIPVDGVITLAGDDPITAKLKGALIVSQQSQAIGLQTLDVEISGALAEPVAITTSGEVQINRQVADLNLVANVGDTRAEGQLRYASFESPQIDAQLRLNRFTPALFALAGPEAAAADGNTQESNSEEDVPLPLDAIRLMDTRANLSIDQVIWGQHRVDDLKAKLRVVNGAATLPKVTGKLHGGRLEMKASLNAKQSTAKINTQGQLQQLDIASALAAAEVEPMLTGRASLDWKLHAQGNTSGAITSSLRGPVNLQTEQAVLQDMGLEKMLCEAVALVNQESLSAQFPTSSPFEALSATINLGKGKARLQPLKAKLANIRLLGKGSMDIDSLEFNTTFTAKLSPGLKKLDPACRVNERITAIDWPVNCRGNANGDPADWCGVDSEQIIQDMAGNELKRKAEKEVEDRFGEEAGDLLKGLLGK